MAAMVHYSILLRLVAVILASVACSGNVDYSPSDLVSPLSVEALFDRWCSFHGRTHSSEADRQLRLDIFSQRLRNIAAHNEAGKSFKMGLNQFSDMSSSELSAMFPPVSAAEVEKRMQGAKRASSRGVSAPPASIDWRWKGAVTGVKDVRSCKGATWTYAASGAVEGALKVNGFPLTDLSAQQLLDCVTDENFKCSYGQPALALEYVLESGIAKTNQYPAFDGANETCRPLPDDVITIAEVERVWGGSDDTDLLNAVAQQPVAVQVDGSTEDFINYKSGVFTGRCASGTNYTQSLLIVGYGSTSDGVDYWTLKNSWGFSWGESGYMRLPRKGGPPQGKCGINAFPSYPTGVAPGKRGLPCAAGQSCPSGMVCCCREPFVGTKCTSHMCCPSKFSSCKKGCCNEALAVSASTGMEEMIFATTGNKSVSV